MTVIPNLIVTDPQKVAELQQKRSCGQCSACCVLPRIPDAHLEKPGYQPCKYLIQGSDGMCGCYETRPEVCRNYNCLWRMGIIGGDERRRPDQIGIMFGVDEIDGRPYMEAWELWEGAVRDYPGRGVVDQIARRTKLLVRYYGVPCSIQYPTFMEQDSLELGTRLSRMAREDPKTLARWLEHELLIGNMVPPDRAAAADFGSLVSGEVVKPWFGRDGKLRLDLVEVR